MSGIFDRLQLVSGQFSEVQTTDNLSHGQAVIVAKNIGYTLKSYRYSGPCLVSDMIQHNILKLNGLAKA